LSFLFPGDEALFDYYDWLLRQPPPRGKRKVAVGCVWTRLEAERELAVLTCTASTTPMSLLFDSISARALWAELGWACDAAAVFFDTENEEQWELVFPWARTVPRPEVEPYLLEGEGLEDECYVSVDACYRAALRLAGLA